MEISALARGSVILTLLEMRLRCPFLFLIVLLLPSLASAQREKLSPDDLAIVERDYPTAKRTSSGLRTVVIREGKGAAVHPGDKVEVLYTGKFLNGKIFEKVEDPQRPFTFQIGRQFVIDGWEEGIPMMRAGEKRILIVPFELGYGSRGDPPRIPRESTLVFEVELLAVHPVTPL
jgi:FKBP-type peptidyl-prolyl cis-trans isomerase